MLRFCLKMLSSIGSARWSSLLMKSLICLHFKLTPKWLKVLWSDSVTSQYGFKEDYRRFRGFQFYSHLYFTSVFSTKTLPLCIARTAYVARITFFRCDHAIVTSSFIRRHEGKTFGWNLFQTRTSSQLWNIFNHFSIYFVIVLCTRLIIRLAASITFFAVKISWFFIVFNLKNFV